MSEKGKEELGKSGQANPKRFYTAALTEAEKMRLPLAREMEGLDEEIALLRVRLVTCALEHPDKFDLLIKGVAMLTKVVSIRYRLSPDAKEDLESSLAGVLEGVGRSMGLGDFGGGDGA